LLIDVAIPVERSGTGRGFGEEEVSGARMASLRRLLLVLFEPDDAYRGNRMHRFFGGALLRPTNKNPP
jgi:hypothetical protein